ncbi:MAG TPA: hypothetical protein VGF25_00190 [Thermoleophilaceae bacterium]
MLRSLRAGCALTVFAIALIAAPAASAEVQHLHYQTGPFEVTPGQNRIAIAPITQKPAVDGYITRMRPDLILTNGTVPRVDVLHLHHGVWLNLSHSDATVPGLPERFFAAGEEKTVLQLPKGYGYPYKTTDRWLLNHMIHNLTTKSFQVYMTYDIDFIPATDPEAKNIKAARPLWLDVQNGSLYPVFDVKRHSGHNGRFTYPNDDKNAYPSGVKKNQWTVDRDGVLIATAGHLHPGGLHTDLYLKRKGATARRSNCGSLSEAKARTRCRRSRPSVKGNTAHLFRSNAKYFEPAGAVSWDVSMTATRPNWRVAVHKGDVLSTTATYDSKRGAWYESMGIMVVWMADQGPGKDPFASKVDLKGKITHGHLRENRNHGGKRTSLPDARRLSDGVFSPAGIDISSFTYRYGDLHLRGKAGRPPVIKAGQSLQFTLSANDNDRGIYHTITSCRAPCTGSTGIAYPLADGKFDFDSGQLGDTLPAVGRLSYRTPRSLPAGTYNYFCRIHPFMRGAFRVKK